MKLSDIQKGKKYYKIIASQVRKRGRRAGKVENVIYVLDVNRDKNEVLASINSMPAQWYNQAVYAKWTAERPQNEIIE